MPEARLDGCLQLAHLSSGNTGCNRSVDFFRERFYSRLTCVELRARMQSIVHSCSCHVKPVQTPVAIFGSLGVCIYVSASRHWLISYSPIHLA